MASIFFLFFVLQSTLVFGQRLSKNDPCTVQGQRSRCTLVNDCDSAAQAIKDRRPPPICGFEGNAVIICCPVTSGSQPGTTPTQPTVPPTPRPTSRRTTTERVDTSHLGCGVRPFTIESDLSPAQRVARRKCHEFARSVYYEEDVNLLPGSRPECLDSCPNEQPLIVGGKEAKGKMFPHMALIGYGQKPEWFCGGSLISEKYVLSAAHCTSPGRYGPARWVRLGELDLSTDFDDAQPINIAIIRRTNHPDYFKAGTYYNDLALYELETAVTFSPYIRPACLKVINKDHVSELVAAGWGRTAYGNLERMSFIASNHNFSGDDDYPLKPLDIDKREDSSGVSSDILRYVMLNVVSNQECNQSYSSSIGRYIPRGIIPTQLCAGNVVGKDTCQGDSGGPLEIRVNSPYCMHELFGVTSFGKMCGMASPGVYTRVMDFVPWIVGIVWPNELRQEERN